jgi:hypothetical protein
MGAVEDVRQVLQDFLAPELREIRTRLDAMDEINRIRYENLSQRLERSSNPSPSTSASPTSKTTSAAPPSATPNLLGILSALRLARDASGIGRDNILELPNPNLTHSDTALGENQFGRRSRGKPGGAPA